MSTRYYICGRAGVEGDRFYPEIADDLALMVRGQRQIPLYTEVDGELVPTGEVVIEDIIPLYSANQELLSPWPLPIHGDRFIVHVNLTETEHAQVAYNKQTNPNGYDWFEISEDGMVSVYAA